MQGKGGRSRVGLQTLRPPVRSMLLLQAPTMYALRLGRMQEKGGMPLWVVGWNVWVFVADADRRCET